MRTRRDLFAKRTSILKENRLPIAKNIWGQFSKSQELLTLPVEGRVNCSDHVPRVSHFLTIGFPGFWCRLPLEGHRAHHAPKECVWGGHAPFFLVFTHDHPVQPGSPHGCWDQLSSHLVRLQGSSPGEVAQSDV